MALTPAEIERLAQEAGTALQQIQDELGRDGIGGKVRFPAGYLKTVGDRASKLLWIGDEDLKRNICYHLIFSDVLRWLLYRTTLFLVARDMVVKHDIAVMGAVAEGFTVAAMRRLRLPVGRFPGRLTRLVAAQVIDEELKTELTWVWNARTNIHIHEVVGLEIDRYPVTDTQRATKAVRALSDRLNSHFLGG